MALLAVKLKNRLNKLADDKWDTNPLIFDIKNVSSNGQSVGCRGFVGNMYSDNVVYVSTDSLTSSKYLYRVAEDFKDYRGKTNRYAFTVEELAEGILQLL